MFVFLFYFSCCMFACMFFVSTLTVNGLFSICLTFQPILRSLSSELVVAYMDDVTLRGTKSTAADDITTRQGVERLKLISAHDALVLLKNSLNAPKSLHTLRSACCADHVAIKLIVTRGKVLSWEYRSPRKRNSRPPASVILCWVSWVDNVLFIMRQVICLFVYIGNVCLHWKKSPVYGVFGQ